MKSQEQILEEGRRMKLYRKLMGLKQCDVAANFKTSQGNYSHIEKGRFNAGWRLEAMNRMFRGWRKSEIERLRKQIEYLESL